MAAFHLIYQDFLKLFNEVRTENFDCVLECYSPTEALMPSSVAFICSPIRVVMWSTASGTSGSWRSLLLLVLLSLLKGFGWASSLVGRLSVSKKWETECTSRFRLASFSPILRSQYIAQYADKLAIVMKKILLISQVASLGRDFEKYVGTRGNNMEAPHVDGLDEMDGLLNYSADDASLDGRSSGRPSLFGNSSERAATEDKARVIDPDDRNPLTGSLNSSQKIRIVQLLGAWEEPLVGAKSTVRVPVVIHNSWYI
jgi:hypothetical protein